MRKEAIDWGPLFFLTLTPLAAAILVPVYIIYFDVSWPIIVLTVFFWYATSIGITAGYHRFLAHRSFKAKKWFEFLMLFFGAGAFQNSALKWCSDHRKHHKFVDTDKDPYSAKRGAFYSHIGWMCLKQPKEFNTELDQDLVNNPLVWNQHKYYVAWAMTSGVLLPTVIGWMLGDAMGGFVLAWLTRMVGVHHVTFMVNSLAHILGRQPYTEKNSAKDSFIVAILTNGEGYHNFHHCFEADYRNGVRWYQWDPTKWMIQVLSWFGQTYSLKRVPNHKILLAKMKMKQQKLAGRGVNTQQLDSLREKFEEAQVRWAQLKKEYDLKKSDLKKKGHEKLALIRLELRMAKIERQKIFKQWQACCSTLSAVAA